MTTSKKIHFLFSILFLTAVINLSACSGQLGESIFGGGINGMSSNDELQDGSADEIPNSLDDVSLDGDTFTDTFGSSTTGGTSGNANGDYDIDDPDSSVDDSSTKPGTFDLPVTIAKEDGEINPDLEGDECTYSEGEAQMMMISMSTSSTHQMNFAGLGSRFSRSSQPLNNAHAFNQAGSQSQAEEDEEQEGDILVCQLNPDDGNYTWQRAGANLTNNFNLAVVYIGADDDEETDFIGIQPNGRFAIAKDLLNVNKGDVVFVSLLPKDNEEFINNTAIVIQNLDSKLAAVQTRDLDRTLDRLGF